MTASLIVKGASKTFGDLRAVDDVSLQIVNGSLTGLIGPNGAGKSTLLNLFTGVLAPSDGSIHIEGHDVTGESAGSIAAMGVERTFQSPRGFASLNVRENVEVMIDSNRDHFLPALFSRERGARGRRARAMELLERVGIAGRAGASYDELSGGELRLLELARKVARKPRILLLDEPTAGVDPSLQDRLSELIRELNAEGVTILVIEHNLGFLMSLATHIHVMQSGRLIASGSPQEIATDERVLDAYIGRGTHASPSD